MNSLKSKSHRERSEPRRGCCQLTGESERKGPWRQGQGLAQGELPLPTAALVASLVGTLKFRKCVPVGAGKGEGVLWEDKHAGP